MKLPTFLRFLVIMAFGLLPAFSPALAIAQVAARPPGPADEERNYVREHYTKHEYKIAMRDGVKLLTAVYAPKDDSRTYPILLTRTPYAVGPYGVDSQDRSLPYAKEGFIFVYQDVRGRYGSEGTFVDLRPQLPADRGRRDIDESTDAYDTIDWIVRNVPNNNGRVGMWGISYPGFYTATGMIDSHPALKCASPQAPCCDWFAGDDIHHNGAFFLADCFGFYSAFGQKLDDPLRERAKPFDFKTPDGYEFFLKLGPLSNADSRYFKGKIAYWGDLMRHGTYDEFWKARDLPSHLKNIKAAVMTVGGWYDAEDLYGALAVHRAVERNNPGTPNMLVMGPWSHGGWSRGDGESLGNVHFHAKTAEFYRDQIELPFLKHYLKDDSKFELKKAYVFETGTDQWRWYDAWPPKNAHERTLYLRAGGRLSFDAPHESDTQFDEYVSDPAKPVPSTASISVRTPREYMVEDQRFVASRPDVLVYRTDPLEHDVTIAGPITVRLNVSSTGTDSDWIVKLIDVYSGDYPNPDPNPAGVQMGGYQQLVRGEPMRAKFRNSFEQPEPLEPGTATKIKWVMPDVDHTFRRGHRIMVQVQSSWFPLVDRNPQRFCDIYSASSDDFQKATERVYHSPDAASQIEVDVLMPDRAERR
jgi:putative CocE/NonD family hydrolase